MQICVPPNIDLIDRPVLIFLCGLLSVSNMYIIEGMAISGYISGRSFKLHKTCQSSIQTKHILLLGTIFRHVALLVTEISHQDQNFQIIPRI